MDRGTPEQASGTTCISSVSSQGFHPVLDKYPSPCSTHINITVTALWVATPFLSTVSVAAVCVAVTTNQWLLTQEDIKNENYTGRGDTEFFPKNTISGLWTLCYTKPGRHEFHCSNIEYFPKEEYSPDLKDSTMAIPYTVTKSAAFFILSTCLLFVGEVCCLSGHFFRERRLLTFVSGVVFIISGLLMLIGLVMYISIFKAEVGGKLRPTSQLQPAIFTYKYGYSFILYVAGFVIAEISGTCAVFLYIYWHQKEWRRKGYELRAKFASLDADPVVVPPLDFYGNCERHPNPLSPRRFYLEGESSSGTDDGGGVGSPSPICLKHSTSCSFFHDLGDFVPKKQSKKVGTDDLSEDCLPLPSELCRHHFLAMYPCEFLSYNCYPKDASTLTDFPWDEEEEEEEEEEDECSAGSHDHDFVPFDLGDGPVSVPESDPARKGEFPLETLTKITPV